MKTVYEMMEEQDSMKKLRDFQIKQQQPYEFKKAYAEIRAREFYDHPEVNGNCYVAVGGLDSITLYVFLKSIGIDVPGVSVSSLEDRSIQKVHKALGVVMLKPSKREDGTYWRKPDVLHEMGFPVLSKEKAAKIELLQNPTEKNATVRHAIITGETGEYGGNRSESRMKLPDKWLRLFGGDDPEGEERGYQKAPFKVSARCCYYLKEKPCDDYAKASGRFPYMGLMASEGGRREKALKLHGCNYISEGTKRSCPFAIFNRTDVLKLTREMDQYYHEHAKEHGWDESLPTIVPEIYGDIVELPDGNLDTSGAKRTGCTMCGFGIHVEERPHRFDKLREKNPREWRYWMYDVGWGKVLDYIGVGWEDVPIQTEQLSMDLDALMTNKEA